MFLLVIILCKRKIAHSAYFVTCYQIRAVYKSAIIKLGLGQWLGLGLGLGLGVGSRG